VAKCCKEQDTLACGVRGEEVGHLVVQEGETRGPETLCVCGEVKATPGESPFKLCRTVAAVPEPTEDLRKRGETVDVHRRLCGKLLEKAQATCCFAKGTLAQTLETLLASAVRVAARWHPFDGVDDHVQIEE
jgi:hypothetical protein